MTLKEFAYASKFLLEYNSLRDYIILNSPYVHKEIEELYHSRTKEAQHYRKLFVEMGVDLS